MANLFISYSRKDRDAAKRLVEAATAQKLDVWIDWNDIPPSVQWWKEIEKGIEEADVFVFLISPDSCSSKVCGQEIDHAVNSGKRLIPVLVRDTTGEQVPSALRSLNYTMMRETDAFETSFQTLMKAVQTDYEWVKFHRRLQVKALDWNRGDHEKSFLLRGKDLQTAETELARNSSKDPHPTDLQREYVLVSRQATERQRKTITGLAIAVAVVTITLAIFGFVQARLANERAILSRARELAAQSVALRARDLQSSLLMGIEAFRLRDIPQTRGVLMDNTEENYRLEMFLEGHTSFLSSFAFSRDGKTLASGSQDGMVILWNLEAGRRIGQPLQGPAEPVTSLFFGQDGKTLAAGNGDGSVNLWDVSSIGSPASTKGGITKPLKSFSAGEIAGFAFDPHGKFVALSSGKQGLGLWDVMTQQSMSQLEIVDLSPNSSSITFDPNRGIATAGAAALSPDGQVGASSTEENTIILANMQTGQQLGQPLHGHTGEIESMAFSPDGSMLASGGWDQTILLWDVRTGQQIGGPLQANGGPIHSLAFNPKNTNMLAAISGARIVLWDVKTRQLIEPSLDVNSLPLFSLAFSPDGKRLVSGSGDDSIIVWNVAPAVDTSVVAAHSIDRALKGHDSTIRSVAFQTNGKLLASGSLDGVIFLWDVRTGSPVGQLTSTEDTSSLHSIAFQPGLHANLLAASSGTEIYLWNVADRRLSGSPLQGHSDTINSLAFSPDGGILASGGDDATIRLWNVATRQPVGKPLTAQDGAVQSVAFSPDGKQLAAGYEDGSVILWDLTTRQPIGQPLKGQAAAAWSVAFSPDGKLLASGSLDRTVRIWNVKTQQPVGTALKRHTLDVLSVAFSPDGKTLASAGDDNSIILWDVATGQTIGQPLRGHTDSIWSIAFSRDGKTIASGGYDTYVVLWDMDPESWIRKSCGRVRRNFTSAEWAQYFPGEKYRSTCPEWPASE